MKTALAALIILCLMTGAQAGCRGGVVHLDFTKDGRVLWNGVAFRTDKEMADRFAKAASSKEQPEIHLGPQRDTEYKTMYRVLAAAQKAGLYCLGFTGLDQPN